MTEGGAGEKVGTNDLILDIIFSNAGAKTIKKFALVNHQWLDHAGKHLKFIVDPAKEKNAGEFEALINSPLAIMQRNIQVVGPAMPSSVVSFGDSLVSLDLVDVVFDSIDQLKEAVFYTFPKMRDLKLKASLRLNVVQPQPIYQSSNLITPKPLISVGVKRLELFRRERHDEDEDVFINWGCEEIFQNFSGIRELVLRECEDIEPLQVFQEIQRNNIQLEYLLYNNPRRGEVPLLGDCVWRLGTSLKDLTCLVSQLDLNDWENFPRRNLKKLTVFRDLNRFGTGQFISLREVHISGNLQSSLRFLHLCPQLHTVNYEDLVPMINPVNREVAVICSTVQEVRILTHSVWSQHRLNVIAASFPNAKKVMLAAQHLETLSAMFEHICTKWTGLVTLSMECLGPETIDSEARSLIGNGRGNTSEDLMKKLSFYLRELEWYRYIGKDAYFGDHDAWIFLSLTNLRYLRLQNATFSPTAFAALKARLAVFEVGNLV